MKKKFINYFDVLIYLIIFLLAIVDYINVIKTSSNIMVNISFLCVLIISYVCFILEKKFISIEKIVYVFIIIFMYLAPLHQFQNNSSFWGLKGFSEDSYLMCNIYLIVFLTLFKVFSKNKKNYKQDSIYIKKYKLTSFSYILMIIINLVIIVYLFLSNQLFGNINSWVYSNSLSVILVKVLRFFPIANIFLFMYAKENNFRISEKYKKNYLFIIFTSAFIIFFPINGTISRYLLFGTYIMLIAIFFKNFKYKSFLLIAILIGFFIIFPAFNYFKYNGFGLIKVSNFTFIKYDSNDLDAYFMFLSSIRYVEYNGILFGENIISALIPFIPRSIWIYKSIPSGQLVNTYFNASFTNVSCPIMAEFYLAFGPFGIIFLSPLVALLVRLLNKNMNKSFLWFSLYYINVGLFLAIMRGALMPMISFVFSIFISCIIVYYIVYILNFFPKLKK